MPSISDLIARISVVCAVNPGYDSLGRVHSRASPIVGDPRPPKDPFITRRQPFMKMHLRTVILAALIAAAAATASAQTGATTATQPGPGWSALKSYTGTIVRVDSVARLVTTRDAGGQTSVFEAPPSLTSSQLAGFLPGDPVTVTFYEGVEVRPRPAGGAPVTTSVDPSTGLRTATVTITAIDPVARTITFIGPRGRYTRTVPEGADASQLRALTIGEKADLAYFEYVQSMTRTAAAVAPTAAPPTAPTPPAPDSVRNRLTVYALYGVDSQFSGKMIEAATGRTTGGAPINLDETTYDEVYGRMAMFKVGVGYRVTPRTEAVLNFVYSRSAATDEATRIGTAGTNPQVPLNVNFTEYQYWGFEGGQRWFFSRVRFTPFVGWLAGINRNQDIRGTFVGVPSSVTPGLAAQDGKFFERSWAFSLGPTGGVLIGVGPFEVMAETQLRFLGGLSDVDWLVEEGLRDVNSKSERWSLPLLVGARIRF